MECRICFSDDHPERFLRPCLCRGTSAYIHDYCLSTYFSYYPDRVCRVCREPMEHPWLDLERNLVCSFVILLWTAVLLLTTTVPLTSKLMCLAAIAGLLIYHVRKRQLTYDATIACIASSAVLCVTEPAYLAQTVFLVSGLLILATLCLYVPPEMMALLMVFSLAVLYSILVTIAVALRTDPAFTGVFLLAMSSFWLLFLRPVRRNQV
jgi:hypothetical protein